MRPGSRGGWLDGGGRRMLSLRRRYQGAGDGHGGSCLPGLRRDLLNLGRGRVPAPAPDLHGPSLSAPSGHGPPKIGSAPAYAALASRRACKVVACSFVGFVPIYSVRAISGSIAGPGAAPQLNRVFFVMSL